MNCLTIVTGLFVIIFAGGCRVSPRQADPVLTQSQEELHSLMSAAAKTEDLSLSLLREVHAVFAEYQAARKGDPLPSDSLLQTVLDSAVLELSSKLFMERDAAAIVSALNDYIFGRRNIAFSSNRIDPYTLFPHLVAARGKGTCVGMTLLYLLIAEKLNVPLFAVLAPGHCFVRFDDGKKQINIETLRKGEAMPESWYRSRYSIEDTVLYRLQNCSEAEVAAILRFNAGTILYHERHYAASVKFLKKAAQQLRAYPEVNGNLALALDGAGKSAEAFEILVSVKKLHPQFEQINENLASVALKCGKDSVALQLYDSLVMLHPRDPGLSYGKAVAAYRLGDHARACSSLVQTLEIDSSHSAAVKLFGMIPCTNDSPVNSE